MTTQQANDGMVHSGINLREISAHFLRHQLRLMPKESFVAYTDDQSDQSLATCITAAAEEIGARAELFVLDSRASLQSAADALVNKIGGGDFSAICELSDMYYYQTDAWRTALKRGSRIYSLQGMDSEAFIRCVSEVHHARVDEFGRTLTGLLSRKRSIRICTAAGTDVSFTLDIRLMGKIVSKLLRRQGSFLYSAPSTIVGPGHACFLAGQVAMMGVPNTVHGTIVVDSFLWPPSNIGFFADEPIILDICSGILRGVGGCTRKAALLKDHFGSVQPPVKHFCLGFHPTARLTGGLMEAERVFGMASVGVGEYPLHIDGLFSGSTLTADGDLLMKDGMFVHSALERSRNEFLVHTQNADRG